MNPRPFYRSRLFWLGLPGLVFLLWGWWLSTGYRSEVGFIGGHPLVIGQVAEEIYVMWDPSGWPNWRDFYHQHVDMPEEQASQWKPRTIAWRDQFPTWRHVFTPYYWPLLAYTATWLLTLTWWQRRKARMLKPHAAP